MGRKGVGAPARPFGGSGTPRGGLLLTNGDHCFLCMDPFWTQWAWIISSKLAAVSFTTDEPRASDASGTPLWKMSLKIMKMEVPLLGFEFAECQKTPCCFKLIVFVAIQLHQISTSPLVGIYVINSRNVAKCKGLLCCCRAGRIK